MDKANIIKKAASLAFLIPCCPFKRKDILSHMRIGFNDNPPKRIRKIAAKEC
jgi:hypothetical protein